MRTVNLLLLLSIGLLGSLAGCVSVSPDRLVQSARADTHLGWKPAPEHQLAFSLVTASGIGRVELQPLPEDLKLLTLELPGLQRVEGVQWQGADGFDAMLFDGSGGQPGVALDAMPRGFRLRIAGEALDSMRAGGILTVVDVYRG